MGACVTAGAVAGLRALGVARRSLRANLIASGVFVVLGVLGAVASGATGSVEGTALATWIGAGASWWLLRIGLREHGRDARHTHRIPRPRRPAVTYGETATATSTSDTRKLGRNLRTCPSCPS
jgi:hypothetical protein